MKKAFMLSKVGCCHILYLLVLMIVLRYAQGSNHYRPHIAKSFAGELIEGKSKVSLNPPLTATDDDAPQLSGLICEYRIFFVNRSEAYGPFHVVILDKSTGEAEVQLLPNTSLSLCNNPAEYDFLIQAVDCGSLTDENGNFFNQRSSKKSKLHISIKEKNEHAPYFPESFYLINVEESVAPNERIVSLEAKDDDCSHAFGNICLYEVDEEANGLFSVMNDGTLISLMEFIADDDVLTLNVSVVAYDCGGKQSTSVLVSIRIFPPCHSGLSGFSKEIDFIATETTSLPVTSHPSMNTCVSRRDIVSAQITVSLDVDEVETITSCDYDISADEKDIQLCDATDQDLFDLLPCAAQYKAMEENTAGLPTFVQSFSHPKKVLYDFNGLDQVFQVGDLELNQLLTFHNLTHPFSVFFNLFLQKQSHDGKQTILCKADGQGLNRHHFAIYVQNCHLMLLLRLQYGVESGLNPAEWHWKLDNGKSCSSTWYRVLLQVHYPAATLYVNDEKMTPFLIADDHPLHPIPGTPKWSVGAAWEGRKSKYDQHLEGQLSSLLIYLDKLDDVETLKCAGRCKEGLKFDEEDNSFVVSSSQYALEIQSDDVDDLMKTLQGVRYFNNDRLPTPGRRSINIRTNITCSPTVSQCPFVTSLITSIAVVPLPDPGIILNGREGMTLQPSDVKGHDFQPFNELSITLAMERNPGNTSKPSVDRLESCVVNVTGDKRKGKIRIRPKAMLRKNMLFLERHSTGVVIRGRQHLGVYQNILQSLIYQNNFADDIKSDVTFTILCDMLNGKFLSNLYTLAISFSQNMDEFYPAEIPEVNPLLSETPATPVGIKAPQKFHLNEAQEADFVAAKLNAIRKDRDGGNVVAMVIGGSVGVVILFVLVVVVARFQGCASEEEERDDNLVKRDTEEFEEELDWDDSAMTVTVNPMNVRENEATDASDADFSEIDDEGFNFVSDHEENHVSCDHSLSRREM